MPGRGPRQDATSPEVLQKRHHVLAARAGRVPQRGWREGSVACEPDRLVPQSLPGGTCPGKVLLHDDEAPVSLELADRIEGARRGGSGCENPEGAGKAEGAV